MDNNIKDLSKFISRSPTPTRPMTVEVIDFNGKVKSTFLAPAGFQLDRYVDALYPENEFMLYATHEEINVSVFVDEKITEIYKGTYK